MKKPNNSKRVIQFMLGLWRIAPVATSVMLITQCLDVILATTIAPIFVSKLLGNIATGQATFDNSLPLLIGYVVVLVFSEVIMVRISIAMSYISESKMQAKIAKRILHHLTQKSLDYHSNKMSGGIVSDANKLIYSVERFWDTLGWNLIPIGVTILSVCTALSFIVWQYAVVLGVLSFVIIVTIVRAQSSIAPISRLVAEKSSAMTAYFADVIGNIAAVKAFAREDDEIKHYNSLVSDWRKTNLLEMRKVLMITGIFSTMMTILNISAFAAAIIASEYHMAAIPVIYLMISYTLNVVSRLWSVSSTTRSYIRVIGDASPMIDTLDEEVELKDIDNPQIANVNSGEIVFENVKFAHKQIDNPLFNNFNLTIKPGEKVGLIGKSGSGKTSLTRLLLRFSDLSGGRILIDGKDIAKLKQTDLRKVIAYVPQEPILFHRSLKDNIAYGRPNTTMAQIRQAAKLANALDFIDILKDGFNTLVGERGIKLSGGQRQRVAIARAILKDAPILVLDEATSALDSENERLIQKALYELMQNRTSIVIAHRLSTISKLDRIVVLDDGKIVEQGTHQELMEKNGTYAKLWRHQSGGFIED